MRAIAIAATALSLVATTVSAQQHLTAEEEGDRFQLFTRCSPVFPSIAVERSSPYVAVGILHWAFVVRVELLKVVTDPGTDIKGAATTWRTYRYGIHSGDPAFVISSLSTAVQTFLEEYLRVNARFCGARGES